MSRNIATAVLLFLIIKTVFSNYENYKNFENDEKHQHSSQQSKSPWQDFLKKAGVLDAFNTAAVVIAEKIDAGQKYDNFDRDWKSLKAEPFNPINVIQFAKNVTIPAFVRACMAGQKAWRNLNARVMNFTLKKCDSLLGREANYHPWNVLKQGKEQVSFLVFVYGACLSLILFKLCSFWNFLGWLAVGYFTYASAGPYWCFKRLVFLTGFFWYLFDLVLTYPIHASLLFLALYLLPYVYSMSQHFGSSPKFIPQKAAIEEFRLLRGKVNKIENKTEEIQRKVEELENLFERMNFDRDS